MGNIDGGNLNLGKIKCKNPRCKETYDEGNVSIRKPNFKGC